MRALLQPQMFAAEVPACIHKLDGIERAAAVPRRHGRMSGFAMKEVLHRDQTLGRETLAVLGAERIVYVRTQHDVSVFE